jgi:hypothetical protein
MPDVLVGGLKLPITTSSSISLKSTQLKMVPL